MLRKKEMLIIVVAQITITLVLTSAKPHTGFAAQFEQAASVATEQRLAQR